MEVKAKYKVLVLGNGGREHALLCQIAHSSMLETLYTTSENPEFHKIATQIKARFSEKNFVELVYQCKQNEIDIVVVGQEKYLDAGISETLAEEGITIFGPTKEAARLESLKSFTKELCSQYNIPVAHYWHFINSNIAKKFTESADYPLVIKADGLASGKGVVICHDPNEALRTIDDMFSGKFDNTGKSIIVEEFLEGQELSFFVLVDGKNVVEFGSARDYKAIIKNGCSFNTGGMGAYSPVTDLPHKVEQIIMRDIIYPTINGIYSMGIEFKGMLFAGIMITDNGPKLLEYNVRFGDPETQCLLPLLKSDLLELIVKTIHGTLNNGSIVLDKTLSSVCIAIASNGYPIEQSSPSIIKGLEKLQSIPNVRVFHAGTDFKDGTLYAVGGRVLNIVATGPTLEDATTSAYNAIEQIDWPEGIYLETIGAVRTDSQMV